jgi:hypothetical protein
MAEADYFEPRHFLYDWQNDQRVVTDQQANIIRQTEADIEAYTGYPDIQLDVARTAVAQLVESEPTQEGHADVIEITSVKLKTVYVATKTDITTGRVIL